MRELKTILLIAIFTSSHGAKNGGKISCFYDHKALTRVDVAKVSSEELKPALTMCNYLVYGYIGFDAEKFEVQSLDKDIDLEKGQNNFKLVTQLKKQYPSVTFLLSVGGFRDKENPEKYLEVLEKPKRRGNFIASLVKLIKNYQFDGVDLAWQFPTIKVKKERSALGSVWHSIKSVVSSNEDTKEKEHKEQFSSLVRELSVALRGEKLFFSLSILPHVNSKAYYDAAAFKDSVDHIHLLTVNYRTPERVENEADYSAPLQYVYDRVPEENVEATVKWWLEQTVPAEKLLIAVPTYGVSWKITKDSGNSGAPPVKNADGPGQAGQYLKTKGLLSYYEICPNLANVTVASESLTLLRRVPDPFKRQGVYAFRAAKDSVSGLWVSYEDPETAARKAQFAKEKGLGGVAIVDISLDDFKGGCDKTHNNYPILKSVKLNL